MIQTVIKRNGTKKPVKFDKINNRIKKASEELSQFVNPTLVAQKVISQLVDNITTRELDDYAASVAASMTTEHPDYAILGGRLFATSLHKDIETSFAKNMVKIQEILAQGGNLHFQESFMEFILKHGEELDKLIDLKRDCDLDYFALKAFTRSYAIVHYEESDQERTNPIVLDCPQHMFMRTAVSLNLDEENPMQKVKYLYDLFSLKYYTHATPTLFNSGTNYNQLASCFLLTMQDDSIEGIYETLKQTAKISKLAGGVGLNISNVRSKNSKIKGTNGRSSGVVPMLKVFNDTANYVDQAGKRKGAFAIYIEPWHADTLDFLQLKKNHGAEEKRARDLFLALWIPDLFMKRLKQSVESGESVMWSLMCPNECPGLSEVHSKDFEELYTKYENEKKYRKQIPVKELWFNILDSQMETGTPYLLYKDACNRKSNQQHLGTIKGSNLCAEIIEYTDKNEVAVCNLASINLTKFVGKDKKSYDFQELSQLVKTVVYYLDKVIDLNMYPLQQAENSNKKHRPVGLGVQGLADVFAMLSMAYGSEEAKELNKQIFEVIYYSALSSSCNIARIKGRYESYENSPVSQGYLQYDLWGTSPSGKWITMDEWQALKDGIQTHGLRNSLLTALMPTATTSLLLGNTESFEPLTSNLYERKLLSGSVVVFNKHLVRDLESINLWSEANRLELIKNNGSVQEMDIPENLKEVYRTVFEVKQKDVVDMSADRGPFICQTQSLNIHVAQPTYSTLTSIQLYAWEKGLKTGSYYLRRLTDQETKKFTIINNETQVCSIDDSDCVSCSS